ncbi:tyrosine-type recombinase/integrase [Nocardiopsis algeriensis]|uniref:tyrosine-type recombinase/integrase n=1 Tax=Nocardiopsis algeriensis TaxID=1478215 RepID=UPI003B431482
MRWGELAGLHRRHFDLEARTVTVRETVTDVGGLYKGKPRSKAGYRTVFLPGLVVPDLRRHLEEYAAPGPNGFVFVGVRGNQLRRSNFSKYWADALHSVGLEDVHLHDLRHTGNTFDAEAGASVPELMKRMGHSSSRAAMIYLHARDERECEIADRLGERAAEELRAKRRNRDGDDPLRRSPQRFPDGLVARMWHGLRHPPGESGTARCSVLTESPGRSPSGADDGNRTRVISLGS